MEKELFEHLYEYMTEHNGLSETIDKEVKTCDTYEEKLSTLIGRLCMPENGGVDMVLGILGLEFAPEDYENVVWSYFDNYF